MKLLPLTSLPRSGSTLLMNILGQNSIFTVGDDSEIGNLLNYNKQFIVQNICHFQLPNELVSDCFLNFCREGTMSWISKISSPDKIFLDKSRHWLKDLDYVFQIFPDLKILINIRDLRGIVNSFEKINNNSLYIEKSNFYNQINYDLQAQRVHNILNLFYMKDGLFSLKELIDMPKTYKNNLYICKYENLLNNPKNELENIYKFLNLSNFNHDFDNIGQKSYNDNQYMPYGIHKINSKIEKKGEDFSFLREDILEMIVHEYNWYYQSFYS